MDKQQLERDLELMNRVEQLQLDVKQLNRDNVSLKVEVETLYKVKARNDRAFRRLSDMIEAVVNKLLRHTIAGMTHGERNTHIRQLCKDMLQVLDVAFDEHDDIPF